MDGDMLLKIIELILLLVSFVIGRYILPKIPDSAKSKVNEIIDNAFNLVDFVATWSEKFIIMQAKFNEASGEEKMNNVVDSINKVLTKNGLEMSDEEIRAIAQQVYENITNQNKLDDK